MLGKLKKRLTKTSQNEQGLFSVIFAIILLICVYVISGELSRYQAIRTFNEIQGTIDVAGVAALRVGVDENAWRDGELVIDRSTVFNTFKKLVDMDYLERITKAQSLRIQQDIKIRNEKIATGKVVPVGYLITDTYITIPTSSVLDTTTSSQLNYYDYFDNEYESISITGQENDGWTEVLVRSISRLVLY